MIARPIVNRRCLNKMHAHTKMVVFLPVVNVKFTLRNCAIFSLVPSSKPPVAFKYSIHHRPQNAWYKLQRCQAKNALQVQQIMIIPRYAQSDMTELRNEMIQPELRSTSEFRLNIHYLGNVHCPRITLQHQSQDSAQMNT